MFANILLSILAATLQDPQPPPPEPEKPKEKPPIASETLKTLVDKVGEKVRRMEEALQASNSVLGSFEAEITGKTLGEIDFKALADNVGTARSSLRDVLKDADLLVGRLDREVLDSMAEEEKLLFKDGTHDLDPGKAKQLTGTIRAILQVHEVLPADSLAKMSLETLAQAIDEYLSPEALEGFLDITSISSDIIKSLMRYRDSIRKSLETLQHLEDILSVLENKSRDLSSLLSREGEAPDKSSLGKVQGLMKEIKDGRDKALSLFRKIGRKVRDLRKEGEELTDDEQKQLDRLRQKYLGTDK